MVVCGEQWECCALFGHIGIVSSQHPPGTAVGPDEQSRRKEGLEGATGNPENKDNADPY